MKSYKHWDTFLSHCKLLKSGDYLQLPDSSEVLKDVCQDFYYSNSKKALKLTNEFQCSILVNGLIFAKDILTDFHNTSTDKVPDLSADKCRSDFNSIQKSVDTLMELKEMLEEWTQFGMMNGSCNDSDSSLCDKDVNIIIYLFNCFFADVMATSDELSLNHMHPSEATWKHQKSLNTCKAPLEISDNWCFINAASLPISATLIARNDELAMIRHVLYDLHQGYGIYENLPALSLLSAYGTKTRTWKHGNNSNVAVIKLTSKYDCICR
ncbi:hypothetical protein BD769DRAFT_1389337 [Suillus cothurnatus]|nr:hypothetical protein BD769DRAFT_1389337 [Suillus cothurnatus]